MYDRFYPNLKSLAESEEGQIYLLKTVYNTWRTHQQVNLKKRINFSSVH